jgi:hypothetical protein
VCGPPMPVKAEGFIKEEGPPDFPIALIVEALAV